MGGSGRASSFRDLIVYQKARAVSERVFELSKSFPREEMFSLTDQVRRSSRSIGAQVAEAWAKRRYQAHFVSKLTDADAEQLETQHWVETASICGFISARDRELLLNQLDEIGRMLQSMISKASQFCVSPATIVREDATFYVAEH